MNEKFGIYSGCAVSMSLHLDDSGLCGVRTPDANHIELVKRDEVWYLIVKRNEVEGYEYNLCIKAT